MSKRNKTIGSLLAVLLCLTLVLAACGQNKNNESASSAPASSAASSEAASSAPESDLPTETGDKNITFLFNHSGAPYAMKMKNGDLTDPYVKYINDLSGYTTKFEWLGQGDDYTAGITARFASGDLPNVIRTNSVDDPQYHPGAVENGQFWDLTDLIDKYAPAVKAAIPPELWASPKVTYNGRIYGIPQTLGLLTPSRVLYVRQDWLDKLGMKTPVTMDDWLAYFDAIVKTDMDGNGKLDEWGFEAKNNLEYSEVFFANFNAYPSAWYEQDDGTLVPGIIAPGMKDAIKFWKNMYDKKYINQDFLTTTGEDSNADIYGGKVGSWAHDWGNYSYSWGPDLDVWTTAQKPGITILPGPTGGVATEGTLGPQTDGIYFIMVFPKQRDNIVDTLKFLNWAYSDPAADKFYKLGIPDYNYTEKDGVISWSDQSEHNKTDSEYLTYQLSIDVRRADINNEAVLGLKPEAGILMDGYEKAKQSTFRNDAVLYMPTIQAFADTPELSPRTQAAGTLFIEFFAKAVTGKVDIDSGFDDFIADWKARGGDKAIQQATDWYKSFKAAQ